MSSPFDDRRYKDAQFEALLEAVRWGAQVIAAPILLLLILWRVW